MWKKVERKPRYRRLEKNLTQKRKEEFLRKILKGKDSVSKEWVNMLGFTVFSFNGFFGTSSKNHIFPFQWEQLFIKLRYHQSLMVISSFIWTMDFHQETYDKNEGSDIKRVVYVKIHATKECLFEYAEHLQVKKLLKVYKTNIFDHCKNKMSQ